MELPPGFNQHILVEGWQLLFHQYKQPMFLGGFATITFFWGRVGWHSRKLRRTRNRSTWFLRGWWRVQLAFCLQSNTGHQRCAHWLFFAFEHLGHLATFGKPMWKLKKTVGMMIQSSVKDGWFSCRHKSVTSKRQSRLLGPRVPPDFFCSTGDRWAVSEVLFRWLVNKKKVIVYRYYHGKPPWNHHLPEYVCQRFSFLPTTLSKS